MMPAYSVVYTFEYIVLNTYRYIPMSRGNIMSASPSIIRNRLERDMENAFFQDDQEAWLEARRQYRVYYGDMALNQYRQRFSAMLGATDDGNEREAAMGRQRIGIAG